MARVIRDQMLSIRNKEKDYTEFIENAELAEKGCLGTSYPPESFR
jgi:hypothetical protein